MPTCATRLLFLVLLLAPQVAVGQPALRVAVPTGCPTEAHFRERLRALSADHEAPAEGRVEIVREGSGYRLSVETQDVTRTLTNASCARLVETAAVIVALGAQAADVPEPAAVVKPTPEPPATEPVRAAPVVTPPPAVDEPRAVHVGAWAELSGVMGVVPEISVRPAAGMRVGREYMGGGVSVDYVAPQSTAGREGVRVQGAGASLLLFARLHARVRLAVLADMHLLWGRGRGISDVRTGVFPVWAGRVELEVVPWLRDALGLGVVLAAALPIERHSFVYADGGTAYRPARYQLFAGVRFSFER